MRPLGIWILFCFSVRLSDCTPAEPAPASATAPIITAPPTNAPTPTAPTECQNLNIAAHLQAPAQILVGQTFTVTVILINHGCGLVGLPKYSLHIEPSDPILETLPRKPIQLA